MAVKWIKTKYPGVRFYEHPTNTYRGKPDRYYAIRYQTASGRREEGVGFLSDGVTLESAWKDRRRLMENIKHGQGPQSLKELRLEADRISRGKELTSLVERRDALTVANLWDRYIQWARIHKRSAREEEYSWTRHIEPRLGHLLARQVSRGHVQELVNDMLGSKAHPATARERTMSPSTVQRKVALARKIFFWAADEPLEADSPEVTLFAGKNPASRIKVPKIDNVRWRILTRKEANQVLDSAKEDQVLHLLCSLSLATGMRREELCTLQKQHVILDQQMIRVARSKNTLGRTLRIPEPLLQPLKSIMTSHLGEFVFPGIGKRHEHYPPDTYTRKFRQLKAVRELNRGITDARALVVVHTLRHTYATWAIVDGMRLLVLKRLMGHKILSTTERYVHLAEDFLHASQAPRP